ncbi:thioredoxin family protein [Shimia sp. FJ5]|uniref:thioredoxin family protein n=1 Tax=Shimia sp. FJ5 TaxID=3079054 RepID=UPI0026050BA9|nr:thioredoxin family protein [Shimia sp. FJ5]MDV4144570.1 thioredoxin family protein [Shimia sp. FJ5]
MKRRDFLALSAATLALPRAALASATAYTPGLVDERLAAGETVFLDFKASWCGTCKAQEKVINALKAEDPAYEANITFINVDWDDYAKDDLTRRLQIPRRSTLVVLRGDEELGRVVAETSRDGIKALMDTALKAAMA